VRKGAASKWCQIDINHCGHSVLSGSERNNISSVSEHYESMTRDISPWEKYARVGIFMNH
jgi:hypothetical protein